MLQALETPCAAFPLRLGAGSAPGVFDFGRPVAFQLVDRLLGGPGEARTPERALSALEQSVLRTVALPLCERLRTSWAMLLPFTADPDGFESDAAAVRARFAAETEAVVASFQMNDGAFAGVLTLGLPAGAVADALESRPVGSAAAAGTPALEAGLRAARVVVTARLPQIRVSARELSRLAPGQVIQTTFPVDGPLEIHVNDRPRFHGALGRVRGNIGVRVTGPIEGGAARTARPREGRVL
jgi:flagellar motor switch protein FliM